MKLWTWAFRAIVAAWMVTFSAWIYASFHSADRDPAQWSSTMVAMASWVVAFLMSAAYAAASLIERHRRRSRSDPPSATHP